MAGFSFPTGLPIRIVSLKTFVRPGGHALHRLAPSTSVIVVRMLIVIYISGVERAILVLM